MDPLSQLSALWRKLTSTQRLAFGAVGAVFVLVVVLVVSWASKPEYAVLFANLDPADGSSILDRLRTDKIPYEVRGGGRTILVPSDQVYETRLALAGDGLPGSGAGFELLDTNKLGWTDFVQKAQYRRALEGEIARTIQTLEEIQAARVHLVVPEQSLFVAEEKPATSSVVLRMKPGARLTAGQVRGIVHLVSSAVEGLTPENVAILDVMGNLLSQPRQDPLIGATSEQISLVRGLEEQLTGKVQTLLETVLGPGKAVVRIAAEMDFERKEQTLETYDADNPVVRSEDRKEETAADGSKVEAATTNYEISKRIEHVSKPTGAVRRLSASVFVDGTYQVIGKGEREYVARTPDELRKYENIIKTAIGFDSERGDEVTVENVAFDTTVMDRERQEIQQSERLEMGMQLGGRIGSIAIVLALFFFLLKSMRRFTPASTARPGVDLLVGGAPVQSLPVAPPPTEFDLIQTRMQELAKQRPDDLARLLRLWIRESN